MNSSTCSKTLISFKDSIHRRWFALQQYPGSRTVMDERYLQKNLLDDIVEKAWGAVNTAQACPELDDPTQWDQAKRELAKSYNDLTEIMRTSKTETEFGTEYYVMPPDVATDIIINHINRIANYVHQLGYTQLTDSGEHGGCRLSGDPPDEISAGALAYCEGITQHNGVLFDAGTKVEHKTGVHHSTVRLEENEEGYDVDLGYTESGDTNWRGRQAAVTDTIGDKFGLPCTISGLKAQCRGKIRNEQELRELAFFMSGVHDVDLLPPDCIPNAVELALDQAMEAVGEAGENAYKRYPAYFTLQDWREVLDCHDEEDERRPDEDEEAWRRRQREREERRHVRQEREDATEAVADAVASVMARIVKSNAAPCGVNAYQQMRLAKTNMQDVEDACRHAAGRGIYQLDEPCEEHKQELADILEKQVAALLQDCDPVAIAQSLEGHAGHGNRENIVAAGLVIKDICEAGGNEPCVEELDRIARRIEEGALPQMLPGLK